MLYQTLKSTILVKLAKNCARILDIFRSSRMISKVGRVLQTKCVSHGDGDGASGQNGVEQQDNSDETAWRGHIANKCPLPRK